VKGDALLQDVFVLDTDTKCFVWVGSGASPNEKKNGFAYAHVSHIRRTVPYLQRIYILG